MKQNCDPNILKSPYQKAWQVISVKPVLLYVAIIQILYLILAQLTWKYSVLSFFFLLSYWAIQEAGLIPTTILISKDTKVTTNDIWNSVKNHFWRNFIAFLASFFLVLLPLAPIFCVLLFLFPHTQASTAKLILGLFFIYAVFAQFGISFIAFRTIIICDTKGMKWFRESIRLFIGHFFEYCAIILLYVLISSIGTCINYFLPMIYPFLSTQITWRVLTNVIVLAINVPVSAWISAIFTLKFLKHTSNS